MKKFKAFQTTAQQNVPIEQNSDNTCENEPQTIVPIKIKNPINNDQPASTETSKNEMNNIHPIQYDAAFPPGSNTGMPLDNSWNLSSPANQHQGPNYSNYQNQFQKGIQYQQNNFNQNNQEGNLQNVYLNQIGQNLSNELLKNSNEGNNILPQNLVFNQDVGNLQGFQQYGKNENVQNAGYTFQNQQYQNVSIPTNMNPFENYNIQNPGENNLNYLQNNPNSTTLEKNSLINDNRNINASFNNQNFSNSLVSQNSQVFQSNLNMNNDRNDLNQFNNINNYGEKQNYQNMNPNSIQINLNEQFRSRQKNMDGRDNLDQNIIINQNINYLPSNMQPSLMQRNEEPKTYMNSPVIKDYLRNQNILIPNGLEIQEKFQQNPSNLSYSSSSSNINTESTISTNLERSLNNNMINLEKGSNSQNNFQYSQNIQVQSLRLNNPIIQQDFPINSNMPFEQKNQTSALLKEGIAYNNADKGMIPNIIPSNDIENQKLCNYILNTQGKSNSNNPPENQKTIFIPLKGLAHSITQEKKEIKQNEDYPNDIPTQKMNYTNPLSQANPNSNMPKLAENKIDSSPKEKNLFNIQDNKGSIRNFDPSNEIPTQKNNYNNLIVNQNIDSNSNKYISDSGHNKLNFPLNSHEFKEEQKINTNFLNNKSNPFQNELSVRAGDQINSNLQTSNMIPMSDVRNDNTKIIPHYNRQDNQYLVESLSNMQNNLPFDQMITSVQPIKNPSTNLRKNYELVEQEKNLSFPISSPSNHKTLINYCILRSQLYPINSLDNLKGEFPDLNDQILEEIFNFEKYNELRIFELGKYEKDNYPNFFFDLSLIIIIFQMVHNKHALDFYEVLKSHFSNICRNEMELNNFLPYIHPNSLRGEDFDNIASMVLKSNLIRSIKFCYYTKIKFSKNIKTELVYRDCLKEIDQALPVSFDVNKFGKNNRSSTLKIESLNDFGQHCKALIKIKFIVTSDKLYYLIPKQDFSKNRGIFKKGSDSNSNEFCVQYINCLIEKLVGYKPSASDGEKKPEEFLRNFTDNPDITFNINKLGENERKIKQHIEQLSKYLLIVGKNIYGLGMNRNESSEPFLNNKSEIVISDGLYHRKNEAVQIKAKTNFDISLCMFCQDKNKANQLELKQCSQTQLHYYHKLCFYNYLQEMVTSKKHRSDIICQICETEFEMKEINASDPKAAKIFSDANNEEFLKGKSEKAIFSSEGLMKNSNCNHEYFTNELFSYLEMNKNRLNSGIKCPNPNCNQTIDKEILNNFLANDDVKKHQSNNSSINYKSVMEIDDNNVISSQIQKKNIRRAVTNEKVEDDKEPKFEDPNKGNQKNINNMNPPIPFLEQKVEIEEKVKNPLCTHSYSLKILDLIIEVNLKENNTIDKIQCLFTFEKECNSFIDKKLIEDSMNRIKRKK